MRALLPPLDSPHLVAAGSGQIAAEIIDNLCKEDVNVNTRCADNEAEDGVKSAFTSVSFCSRFMVES